MGRFWGANDIHAEYLTVNCLELEMQAWDVFHEAMGKRHNEKRAEDRVWGIPPFMSKYEIGLPWSRWWHWLD